MRSSSLDSTNRFTEQDANLLFAFTPGKPDDPAFFREFLSTFQQVPGYPAPPPNADRKLPFYMQCNVNMSLPKSPNDPNVQKTIVKGEATIPLGALIRGRRDNVFLRRFANEAFTAFRDTGMEPLSKKLKCVCCGKPNSQTTKNVQAVILGVPAQQATNPQDEYDSIVGLTLVVDPFFYLCSRPKCMAKVLKAKEEGAKGDMLRLCHACGRYEDPTHKVQTCSRCKSVFYCNATCQRITGRPTKQCANE